MSVEAIEPAQPVKDDLPHGAGRARFIGATRSFWRIVSRGAVLLLLTLGLYRFWLATDMRRFLWANTEIDGDGLEYTGTALQLLLGFLIAIVLLVPVYAGLFIAALDLGIIGRISGLLAVGVLAVLGQFAIYRARRYRLTRTVFRGLRFHQTGSAWRYAISAVLWWIVVGVTFGLAYPWAQANLERYKMRHTYYGDLPGHFSGSAFRLFFRGFLLWLAVIGPFFFGLFAMVSMVEWQAVFTTLRAGGDDVLARLEGATPGLGAALGIGLMAIVWAVLAAAVFYPAFQAITLRWWLSGIRFGKISISSTLRAGKVYAVYVRFLWYSLLLALLIALVATLGLAFGGSWAERIGASAAAELGLTAAAVGGYVVVALAYSAIYQTIVKLGLWRLSLDSLELTGLEQLDHVKARGRASSAVGEGMADVLQVGGI